MFYDVLTSDKLLKAFKSTHDYCQRLLISLVLDINAFQKKKKNCRRRRFITFCHNDILFFFNITDGYRKHSKDKQIIELYSVYYYYEIYVKYSSKNYKKKKNSAHA